MSWHIKKAGVTGRSCWNHTSISCFWSLAKYYILFTPYAFYTYTHTDTHTYTCILHYLITLTPLNNSPFPETFGFLFIHFQWMGHVIVILVQWSDNCRLIASNLARRTSKPCSACGTLPRPGLKQTWDTGKPPRTAQRRYVVVLILISNN